MEEGRGRMGKRGGGGGGRGGALIAERIIIEEERRGREGGHRKNFDAGRQESGISICFAGY